MPSSSVSLWELNLFISLQISQPRTHGYNAMLGGRDSWAQCHAGRLSISILSGKAVRTQLRPPSSITAIANHREDSQLNRHTTLTTTPNSKGTSVTGWASRHSSEEHQIPGQKLWRLIAARSLLWRDRKHLLLLGLIRLKRIYNFWCSMLIFTPFALCFVTLRGIFMHFPELTY
jgi:hypothetical protein